MCYISNLSTCADFWKDLEVRRRYSEFASLRDALARLHPTLIIPPIPEKHTMADYAANPTKAKQDQQIIDLRKRMLAVFLNRCRRMDEVRNDGVWWRFLDPNSSWVCRIYNICWMYANLPKERSIAFASNCFHPKICYESPAS
jgi:PX domain-containing protein